MSCKKSTLLLTHFIIAVGLVFSSGCATILSKGTYPVYVNSNPAKASLVIRDSNSEVVFQGETPATIKLKASEGFFKAAAYSFEFTLPGYATKIRTINATIDPYYLLNLLGPNPLGLLIIDPLTGAMWKLKKDYLIEELNVQTAATDATPLKVLLLADVPHELRAEMIPIPQTLNK